MRRTVVRVPVRPRPPRRGRTARERMLVWVPFVSRALVKVLDQFPLRSRLRRGLIVQSVLSGWEAVSRGDFELLRELYGRDAVYATEMPPRLRLPDSPRGGEFKGWPAIHEYQAGFLAAWSDVHFALREILLIDPENIVIAFGHLHTRGRASGVEVDIPIATLVRLRRGQIARQEDYWDHADALRAAGLDPADYPDIGAEARTAPAS